MILIPGRGVPGTARDGRLPAPSAAPRSGSRASRASRPRRRVARLLLLGLLGLGRCEPPPPPPAVPRATAGVPAAVPVPVRQATAADDAALAEGKPPLLNDPSAAPNTPLCGQQARERNAIGAALQAPQLAASGVCAGFACYDPLTATYLGADGYEHVCR